MLVLSRKVGESFIIGDSIKITITRIDSHRVRLGFDAPDGTEIWREEVYAERQADGNQERVTA